MWHRCSEERENNGRISTEARQVFLEYLVIGCQRKGEKAIKKVTLPWFNNVGLFVTHEWMFWLKFLGDEQPSSLLDQPFGSRRKTCFLKLTLGKFEKCTGKMASLWQDVKFWSLSLLLSPRFSSSLAFLISLSWTLSMHDGVLKCQFQDRSNDKMGPGQGQELGRV